MEFDDVPEPLTAAVQQAFRGVNLTSREMAYMIGAGALIFSYIIMADIGVDIDRRAVE